MSNKFKDFISITNQNYSEDEEGDIVFSIPPSFNLTLIDQGDGADKRSNTNVFINKIDLYMIIELEQFKINQVKTDHGIIIIEYFWFNQSQNFDMLNPPSSFIWQTYGLPVWEYSPLLYQRRLDYTKTIKNIKKDIINIKLQRGDCVTKFINNEGDEGKIITRLKDKLAFTFDEFQLSLNKATDSYFMESIGTINIPATTIETAGLNEVAGIEVEYIPAETQTTATSTKFVDSYVDGSIYLEPNSEPDSNTMYAKFKNELNTEDGCLESTIPLDTGFDTEYFIFNKQEFYESHVDVNKLQKYNLENVIETGLVVMTVRSNLPIKFQFSTRLSFNDKKAY